MVPIEIPKDSPFTHGQRRYVRAPRPIEFPSEEEAPETKAHLEARTTLYVSLKDAFAARCAIGSQQFVYWDGADPGKRLSPDVFVKLGTPDEPFDNWKIWERCAPELAVEIVSASDGGDEEWREVLVRYQASGIRELVRFDPANDKHPIRAWERVEEELLERAPDSTHLCECMALGLWWIATPSAYGPMLRLARDPEGRDVLSTPGEREVRLVEELAEERRACSLAEQERARAEHARLLAEDQAEIARLRAELERLRGGSR